MTVELKEYRDNEYKVIKDGVLKCKHKPLEKARAFAGRLAGSEDYIDSTVEPKKKDKKKKSD